MPGKSRRRAPSPLTRKIATRQPRKTLVIFCEGERTEPVYLEALKRQPEVKEQRHRPRQAPSPRWHRIPPGQPIIRHVPAHREHGCRVELCGRVIAPGGGCRGTLLSVCCRWDRINSASSRSQQARSAWMAVEAHYSERPAVGRPEGRPGASGLRRRTEGRLASFSSSSNMFGSSGCCVSRGVVWRDGGLRRSRQRCRGAPRRRSSPGRRRRRW